jgi:cystathionine beta-lyase/cystathionine gamma-synthase
MAAQMSTSDGFSTRALRAALRGIPLAQRPNSVPIYQAATFSAQDSDELAAILTDEQAGFAYSRIDNPTSAAMAAAVAELEGAQAGQAFASGMGAIHATLISLVGAGDHVVASGALYGSTRNLLSGVLARLGVETSFVDARDPATVERAIRPATKVLYLETIANPTITVVDLEALAAVGHRHALTVVVDNTFASPYLCQPLALGADLVIHSGTKYLGGHGDVIAGVTVGDARRIRAIRDVQIDTGGTLAPFSAWLVLRGIETLGIRMERHCANGLGLARSLEGRGGVRRVLYPGLPSHPDAEVAARELRAGGGMLAFELEGGRTAGRAFLDALSIGERTASLGAVFTMAVHPPSTTHRQLDAASLAEAGIDEGLIRVSVGIEDLDDLARAFGSALEVASEAVPLPV